MIQNGMPKHWKLVPLSQVAEVRLGRQRSPKRAVGDHMRPYMRAANVTWRGIDASDVKTMDFSPREFETYELKHGDILLSEASGSSSEVGKPAIWRDEVPGACFQNTLIRVRAPRDLVPFLHVHFVKDALTGAFARASRGVGIHHLGAEAMSSWLVTLPPPGEQHSIVAAIDSHFSRLDAATATLERVQRNLERYRASVLKAAVEGRLVPTEAELARKEGRSYEPASVLLKRILAERRRRWEEAELAKLRAKGKAPTNNRWKARYVEPAEPDTAGLPVLPEGWCWASVEALYWDAGYGTSGKCTLDAGGPPVLRIPNVQDQALNLSDLKFAVDAGTLAPDGAVEPGDFLFIRTNGSVNLIGRGAVILDVPSRKCFFASYLIRLRLAGAAGQWRWFAFAWHTSVVRHQLVRDAASSAGQHNVSLSAASKYLMPLPPACEQARILAAVDRLETGRVSAARDTSTGSDRIARLRQSILKRAFEGRLVNAEPGGVPSIVPSRS